MTDTSHEARVVQLSLAQAANDITATAQSTADSFMLAAAETMRPSVLMRPQLTVDGNMYCALYGVNLVEGVAGFGRTADAAMQDFDKNWLNQTATADTRE